MVVLPQKQALTLLPDLMNAKRIEGAFAKIQQLIGSEKAQLVANLVGKLRDREKGLIETLEEVRYPVEFDPPNVPQNVPENVEALKSWPHVGVTPTAYEPRKVGAIMDLDASVNAAETLLEIKCSGEHVRFLRWEKVDCGKLADGQRLFIEQPAFHSMKSTGSFYLANGERLLIGTHKLKDTPDRIEFFLFKATAVPAQK